MRDTVSDGVQHHLRSKCTSVRSLGSQSMYHAYACSMYMVYGVDVHVLICVLAHYTVTMVVPHDIGPADPLDAYLLIPVPNKLPINRTSDLETTLAALESHLDPAFLPNDAPIDPALLTAQMRSITRNAYTSVNAARVEASKARQVLDKQDTVLRGVEYERARIQEEIEHCNEYK